MSTEEELRATEERVLMGPTADLAEAGRGVIARNVGKLLESMDVVRKGDDADAVHEARVAVRRLRAAFEILGGSVYEDRHAERLRRSLARLGSVLGNVRDADVLIERLEAPSRSPGDALEEAKEARKRAQERACAVLDARKTERALARLCKFATTPGLGARKRWGAETNAAPHQVRDRARSILWRRYEEAHAYEPTLAGASIERLHRLRVAVKRLRYALELFSGALGRQTDELIEQLVAIQDHLGDLHDADLAVASAGADRASARSGALQAKRDLLYRDAPKAIEVMMGEAFRARLSDATARL